MKNHDADSSQNIIKFTNLFIKKIESFLDNFNYNVIIANMHEMYSFFVKELNKGYTRKTLIENYVKILITISPVIPHFASEMLYSLKNHNNFKWPDYDEGILIEERLKIVIQFNGKKEAF